MEDVDVEELEIMLWKRERSGTKSPMTAAIASYGMAGEEGARAWS